MIFKWYKKIKKMWTSFMFTSIFGYANNNFTISIFLASIATVNAVKFEKKYQFH